MPALNADVRLVAARADLVVVRQVDIEDEFLGEGAESGLAERLAVAWVGGVDRADFEAGGVKAENLFAESDKVVISTDGGYLKYGRALRFKSRERLVAQIRVVLESKCELSVPKIVGGVG